MGGDSDDKLFHGKGKYVPSQDAGNDLLEAGSGRDLD